MKPDILSLLRPHIKDIKPYASARSEFSGEASVWLDANENPYGSVIPDNLNRYPDPLQLKLKERLSAIKNVPVENIFLGNGSDEPIDLLIRAFCEPGKDKAVILPPTYGMYETSASINNVELIQVRQKPGFQPDVDAIREKIDHSCKILFICNPNNPTGNLIPASTIHTLAALFPGVVVIDEAYIDFTSEPSWSQKLAEYPNIVVLQTLSKAWGMANIRLGMAFAHAKLIDILNKIKAPYNINGLTQRAALEALENRHRMEEYVKEIVSQREALVPRLMAFSFVKHIYPSDSNFLLVEVTDANDLYQYLSAKGIIVRNRAKEIMCENCLRITVGNKDENQKLISAFKEYFC
ncbi:MAG TPA: histidinol-phosphate transaminase [Chitinophagaceae bacterium]|nr:histidinol-phosphate transaminase [Chitinophagaceae bacterium]